MVGVDGATTQLYNPGIAHSTFCQAKPKQLKINNTIFII